MGADQRGSCLRGRVLVRAGWAPLLPALQFWPRNLGCIPKQCATSRFTSRGARLDLVTRAITVRLDEADAAALKMQAEQLRLRPGTLARILVHGGLSGKGPVAGTLNARAALDRLVLRSQQRASADAVSLVADARIGLEPDR